MANFERGFTLIELMLVVAILVVLAAAGFAIYSNSANSTVLENTEQTIISDLRSCREKTLNGDGFINCGIHFDGTNNNYQIFTTPTTYSDPAKTVLNTTSLTNGVTFTTPATGATLDVIFNKISGSVGTATDIVIAQSGNTKDIGVNTLGAVFDSVAGAGGGGGTGGGIALVQQANSARVSGVSTDLLVTLPQAVTAGDLIVVAVSSWPGTPTPGAITDNLGNTYTELGTPVNTVNLGLTTMYFTANAKAGSTTVDFFMSSSSNEMSLVAAEFSGLSTTAPSDGNSQLTGSGATPASGSLAPTTSADLLVGGLTHDNNVLAFPGTGFTSVADATDDSSTHQPLSMEYEVLTSSASTQATFSLTPSASWAAKGALFK